MWIVDNNFYKHSFLIKTVLIGLPLTMEAQIIEFYRLKFLIVKFLLINIACMINR